MTRLCLLTLALFGVVGCGGGTTYEGPGGEKANIAAPGGSVSLPDNLPADVAIYPGATALSTATADQGTVITLQSSDSADKVKQFYDTSLKDKGWDVQAAVSVPTGFAINGKKGDRYLSVSIAKTDAATMITVTYGE